MNPFCSLSAAIAILTLYQTIPCFHSPCERGLLKTNGKGKNADYQHFILFPQCFLSDQDRNNHFSKV